MTEIAPFIAVRGVGKQYPGVIALDQRRLGHP